MYFCQSVMIEMVLSSAHISFDNRRSLVVPELSSYIVRHALHCQYISVTRQHNAY